MWGEKLCKYLINSMFLLFLNNYIKVKVFWREKMEILYKTGSWDNVLNNLDRN